MYHTPFRATWKSKISSRSSWSEGWVRGGEGVGDTEFPGVLKKLHAEFPGVFTEKKWNFQQWSRVNHVEFLSVLVSGLGISESVTKFSIISRSEALLCIFCLEFTRVKYQTEIPGFLQVCSQPPATCMFFFLGIAEIQSVINQEFWSFRFRVIQKFGIIIFLSFLLEV